MSEDYLQPDFFRFGSDSLLLVREVFKRTRFNEKSCRLLELGAGSGVISCELSQRMKLVEVIMLEAQPEWRPYLEHNMERFLKTDKVKIIWDRVGKFNQQSELQVELVVCNPPYFSLSQGKPSPDLQRNIAHRFVLDPWEEWLRCMQRSLVPGGEAWFLQKHPVSPEFQYVSEEGYFLTHEMSSESLELYCLRRLNIE